LNCPSACAVARQPAHHGDNQQLTKALAKVGLARATDELKSKAEEKLGAELKGKVPGDTKKVLDGFLKKKEN
jgi:hypothetical protein